MPFDCKIYSHKMPSGETVKRQWLSYSKAKGAFFCTVCVAFEPPEPACVTSNSVKVFKDFCRVAELLNNELLNRRHLKPIASMFKITFDQ